MCSIDQVQLTILIEADLTVIQAADKLQMTQTPLKYHVEFYSNKTR